MVTVSVYLQQALDVKDHILYGVVNAVSGSAPNQTVSVTQAGNYGGSIFFGETSANKGPFVGSEGKTVRRYTSADWNTKGTLSDDGTEGGQRPYVASTSVGTIASVPVTSPVGLSFISTAISDTWAIGNVWAIDYHSPYSFGKYAGTDKYNVLKTADETKAANSGPHAAGTSTSKLPLHHMHPLFFSKEPVPGAPLDWQKGVFSKNGEQDIDPLTTKWELRCDTLGRMYTNSAIPLPIPSMGRADQYYNMLLDIGMRQEIINMTGTLVDRGAPSASNPRLQTLFDLVRTQHSPTMNLNEEDQGGDKDEKGRKNTVANPMAYLRLTIGGGYEPSDYQESTGVGAGSTTPTPDYGMNTNLIVRDRNYTPGGPYTTAALGTQRTEKSFRGLVTQFSANLMGGKPDIWTWNMTFNVVKNEHDWTFSAGPVEG